MIICHHVHDISNVNVATTQRGRDPRGKDPRGRGQDPRIYACKQEIELLPRKNGSIINSPCAIYMLNIQTSKNSLYGLDFEYINHNFSQLSTLYSGC